MMLQVKMKIDRENTLIASGGMKRSKARLLITVSTLQDEPRGQQILMLFKAVSFQEFISEQRQRALRQELCLQAKI